MGKKITIVNVSPKYFRDSYHQYMFERLRMLDSDRFNVVFVYLRRESDEPNLAEEEGYFCYYLCEGGRKTPLVRCIINLAVILRKHQADIVYAQNHKATVRATLSGILAKTPVILSHMHSWNICRNLRRRLFYATWGRKITRLIACSRAMQAETIRTFPGVSPERVSWLPNSIHADRLRSVTENREAVRRSLDIPPDCFLYIAAGRLVPVKGFDVLLHAFAEIYKMHNNAHLLIVGEGVLRTELLEMAESLGISKDLHMPGHRTDILEVMKASDCFVLSSRWEGMPLVLLEAAFCGLPLVATDCGGVTELIDQPEFGTIVDVDNAQQLADAMEKQLRLSATERQRQVQALMNHADVYTHAHAVAETETLFHELLQVNI